MRASLAFALALSATVLAVGHRPATAQSATATHVGHIMNGFPQAPNGAALLTVRSWLNALANREREIFELGQHSVRPMPRR